MCSFQANREEKRKEEPQSRLQDLKCRSCLVYDLAGSPTFPSHGFLTCKTGWLPTSQGCCDYSVKFKYSPLTQNLINAACCQLTNNFTWKFSKRARKLRLRLTLAFLDKDLISKSVMTLDPSSFVNYFFFLGGRPFCSFFIHNPILKLLNLGENYSNPFNPHSSSTL